MGWPEKTNKALFEYLWKRDFDGADGVEIEEGIKLLF